MDLFSIASTIVVLSAAFGYINVRFLHLPNAIGLTLVSIVATFLLAASSWVDPRPLAATQQWVRELDFEHVLLDVLLGFLLFAGALHTNFEHLRTYRWPVFVFATLGVVASTLIVATMMYFALQWLGLSIPFLHCLLFGALISPTDPIAVLGILRKAKVPKSLEIKIVGESLFNDGVGVVLFLTILSVVQVTGGEAIVAEAEHEVSAAQSVDWLSVVQLLTREVIGGIVLGLSLGYATFRLLKSIDDYEIEVIITLACVMGGFSLAHWLHVSAPLAMVVAGLFVGNDIVRGSAMSQLTEQYVDKFWELTDVMLNVVLFALIGLEVLILSFRAEYLWAAALAILVVLLARFVSLVVPIQVFKRRLDFAPYSTTIMTWGGLRGGISIALALSLPITADRDLFLTVTYGVVVFSIVVQGMTIGKLAQQLLADYTPMSTASSPSALAASISPTHSIKK
ncbi:MAG: sodium:proton antiporter [Aureliella sp.]